METIRDASPVSFKMHSDEHQDAKAHFFYLVKRRDELTDRIRFGIVALNGASIIALISVIGGGKAAEIFGFTPFNSVISATCFFIGLVLGGYAIMSQQNAYVLEAGDAAARAITARSLVAMYEMEKSSKNHESYGQAMASFNALPHVGFQFRKRVIAAQNFGAAAWALGIGTPLASVVKPLILSWWASHL